MGDGLRLRRQRSAVATCRTLKGMLPLSSTAISFCSSLKLLLDINLLVVFSTVRCD